LLWAVSDALLKLKLYFAKQKINWKNPKHVHQTNRTGRFCEIHWFIAFYRNTRAPPPGIVDGICFKLYIRINDAPDVLCPNYTAV